MSDKTFWGILAGILVGWIIAFVLLVMPKMNEYSELSDDLQKRTKKLKSFASTAVEEMPTEQLVEQKTKHYQRWQENIETAREFYRKRDRDFERDSAKSLAAFNGEYQDAYAALQQAYISHAGLPEEARVPFKKMQIDDPDQIDVYQKQWQIQKAVVEAVLNQEGSVIEDYSTEKDPGLPELKNFSRSRVKVVAKVPPATSDRLVSTLLAHPVINFEVHQLVKVKSAGELQYAVVKEMQEGEEPPAEPLVNMLLELDVLDWREPEEETEED